MIALDATAEPAHVLVVDDVEKNTRLLADLLGAKGYRTSVASSGEQALALIEAAPPDLVLLDVMMPGMSGYEVCQKLRADPRHSLLPVVLVTALDPAIERAKGLDAGADDFLNKPINQAELLARVRALLRVKTLQDQVLRGRGAAVAAPPPAHYSDVVVLCVASPGVPRDGAPGEPVALLARLQTLLGAIVERALRHDGILAGCTAQGVTVLFNASQTDAAQRALRLSSSLRSMNAGLSIGIARGSVAVGQLTLPDGRGEMAAIGPAVVQAGRLSRAARADEALASAELAAEWGDAAESAGQIAAEGGDPALDVARVLTLDRG